MRTLHVGLRVADRSRSVAFYAAVGYDVVGEVPESGMGHLTMLKLPADDFVSIELVHDTEQPPVEGAGRLSHLVISVESLAETLTKLAARGIKAEAPTSPDGSPDFLTSWIVDPDGNRIELVQWPRGHAVGLSAADWPAD